MKKYLWLVLVLSLILSYKAVADDVAQKTDGSFVGDNPPKPINSSFIGDDTKSVDDNSFVGEDVQKKTDTEFVGANTIPSTTNTYFAGDNSDLEEQEETNAPFAQDNSKMTKDGVFIGQDVQKQTDNSFVGSN